VRELTVHDDADSKPGELQILLGASDRSIDRGKCRRELRHPLGIHEDLLDPGVVERLFRPFFTTRNDGNGLGLWISLGLVERYGGSITARNGSRGGAVFRVTLWTEPQVPQAPAGSTHNGRPEPA